ncbi:hypothetical protein J7L05_08875 [bacterium]|nr:hypothetical protein [bacterium]
MPIIPDSDYQFQASNRIIPRTYGQGYSDGNRVRLIGTGPLELYESQLNPPQMINTMPVFSVRYDTLNDPPIGTLKFPQNWKHNISWELKCRYCWNDGENCAHYETTTADSGSFIFDSAFDDTNPDFPDLLDLGITTSAYPNPVVMYGYELADYLEEIFTNVPLYDDAGYPDPPFDIHCYSKKRY